MKNNIKRIRQNLEVSCQDIALIMGCSQQNISCYERGSRNPSLQQCRKLVKALTKLGAFRLKLDDLFPEDK